MATYKTVVASVGVVALGVVILLVLTRNFTAYTTEGLRRNSIETTHPSVPAVELETQNGERITLDTLRGKWLLVDFIYTRCMTYCLQLGAEFGELQKTLEQPIADGKVRLVSISFDPAIDTPSQLRAYQQRFGVEGQGWIVTRPTHIADLPPVLSAFGVAVIPDQYGGFIHNTGIVVVNPSGRMVAVLDQGNPHAVASALRKLADL